MVMERLQRQVAKEFGLAEEVGLQVMRQAEELLPGDSEVREISLYRKFNRCRDGSLTVGDSAPNAPLYDLEGSILKLHDLVQGIGQKLVIFSGSYT